MSISCELHMTSKALLELQSSRACLSIISLGKQSCSLLCMQECETGWLIYLEALSVYTAVSKGIIQRYYSLALKQQGISKMSHTSNPAFPTSYSEFQHCFMMGYDLLRHSYLNSMQSGLVM